MGKVKRLRQKYHAVLTKQANEKNTEQEELSINLNHLSLGDNNSLPIRKTIPHGEIFAGVDINFDLVKKTLVEDDKLSVRSIAKSYKYDSKGKKVTKEEKRKLRHTLLLRKIDTLHQIKKESKKKKKKHVNARKPKSEGSDALEYLCKLALDSISCKKQIPVRTKCRKIEKTKHRLKSMLDDIALYRKVISDPTITDITDTMCTITSDIQDKIQQDE